MIKVEIIISNTYIITEIVNNGRFMVRCYTSNNRIIYAREQAAELARILNCKVEEKIQ